MQTAAASVPDTALLTPLQERVAQSLAAGSTITGAAEEAGVHRVTVYRWIRFHPAFAGAVRRARAEFALSRRDDLHYLTSRAMETLLAILDNPRSSPSVLLRASMFILQRSDKPDKAWRLPQLLPENDLPELEAIDRIDDPEPDPATECNTTQQEMQNEMGNDADSPSEPPETCEAPYRDGVLPSCPVPSAVVKARIFRGSFLDAMDDLKTIDPAEYAPLTKAEREGCGAA